MSPAPPENTLEVSDVLFFDNLALHYLVNETPPPVLARVFVSADSRIGGCLLGVMAPKQRETIHALMADSKDGDQAKNRDAAQALMIIAEDIIKRGHIQKKGPRHFYGVPAEPEAPATEPS